MENLKTQLKNEVEKIVLEYINEKDVAPDMPVLVDALLDCFEDYQLTVTSEVFRMRLLAEMKEYGFFRHDSLNPKK